MRLPPLAYTWFSAPGTMVVNLVQEYWLKSNNILIRGTVDETVRFLSILFTIVKL